ncbi:MAG: hypothetical protein SXA11_14275 [Cyanobacteriota bacterium]|nr:hypothetical protein [Cyanobacteriota bacterium]
MSSTEAKVKDFLEGSVARENFNMRALFQELMPVLEIAMGDDFNRIKNALPRRVSDYVFQGIVRSAFFIELVKIPKIDSTKFRVRWREQLRSRDPRYGSFEECFYLLEKLTAELAIAIEDSENNKLLQLFSANKLLPYEIPLDYQEATVESQMHRSDNLVWFWDDLAQRVLKLRALLLGKKSKSHTNTFTPFWVAAYKKIKVKTYLSDRVLTGEYKTNREKRWETHPASVHFALRRTCWEIEFILINQLCHFEGFPKETRQLLEEEKILLSIEELRQKLEPAGIILPDATFRCPITMEALRFSEFEREINDPKHGKTSFQVGHINPLKALSDLPYYGHTPQNISWISSNGNRIQGSLSLQETRDLILQIQEKYQQFGIFRS